MIRGWDVNESKFILKVILIMLVEEEIEDNDSQHDNNPLTGISKRITVYILMGWFVLCGKVITFEVLCIFML